METASTTGSEASGAGRQKVLSSEPDAKPIPRDKARLGNTPFATGNASDSLHALVDGQFTELRVPYPMGFYAKGLDGRIDATAGWKGRGLWSTYATRTPFHMEGGKGTKPKVVKFQLRPDLLAR